MSSRTRGEDDEEMRCVREAEVGLGVSCGPAGRGEVVGGPAGRGEVVGGGRETVVKQTT